jgi:hypothetical protein
MRRIGLIGLVFVPCLAICSMNLVAELRIEVTQGVDNAVRVAVVPFEWRV